MAFDFHNSSDGYDEVLHPVVSKEDHIRLVEEINHEFSDIRRYLKNNHTLADINIAKYKYDKKDLTPYIEVYTSDWTKYDDNRYAVKFIQMFMQKPLLFKTIKWKLMPCLWKIIVGGGNNMNLFLRSKPQFVRIGNFSCIHMDVDIDLMKGYMDFLMNKQYSYQSMCKHIFACAFIVEHSRVRDCTFTNLDEIEEFRKWYVKMCESRQWKTVDPRKIADTRLGFNWSTVFKNTLARNVYLSHSELKLE